MAVVLGLNLLLIVALVIVGVTAHSVAVLAEGVDYLADAAAIGVSLLAVRLSTRRPTSRRPLGYPKATRIAALINSGWLLVLNVGVALGASWRLLRGTPHVRGLPVLGVSAIAAALMLVGALILRRDEGERDLNTRAVLLDTAADAAAAAGVAASGAVIYVTGRFYWLDPSLALLIAVVVGYRTIALLNDVITALRAADASSA
jgi:cobalt-zinc-cadmium efflux system protein